jgi:hypothetical protein
MFTKYKLTLISTIDNGIIDSTVLEYNSTLNRVEVVKLVKQYLSFIGYYGKRFKFSLKKVKE